MSANLQHRRRLGETLRFLRAEASLTQERLAEEAELSAIFISRIERGIESPSLDSLVKIAKALKVRVRDLVADV
jgi:transcriptional regulator with XRE-family HTH domain